MIHYDDDLGDELKVRIYQGNGPEIRKWARLVLPIGNMEKYLRQVQAQDAAGLFRNEDLVLLHTGSQVFYFDGPLDQVRERLGSMKNRRKPLSPDSRRELLASYIQKLYEMVDQENRYDPSGYRAEYTRFESVSEIWAVMCRNVPVRMIAIPVWKRIFVTLKEREEFRRDILTRPEIGDADVAVAVQAAIDFMTIGDVMTK